MVMRSFIISLLITVGCTTKRDIQSNKQEIKDLKSGNNATVLLKNFTLHNFSSLDTKDSLILTVKGNSIEEAMMNFKIITNKGEVILDESYEAKYLLDYGFDERLGEYAKEDYIKKRVDEFFLQERFHRPAITQTEIFDEDYSEKNIWDDIRSDSTSVGFYYLIGEENGRNIAYSKRLKKVVLYFSCC